MFDGKRSAFTPSQIIYRDSTDTKKVLLEWTGFFYHRLRAVFAAVLLMLIAAALGEFTYRIITSTSFSFENLMNLIFRQPLPSWRVIMAAMIASFALGTIFMAGKILDTGQNEGQPVTGFSKFLAGISIIVALDFLVFGVNSYQLYSLHIVWPQYMEALASQLGTAILILLSLSLYNHFVSQHLEVPTNLWRPKGILRRVVMIGWFYITGLGLIVSLTALATNNLPVSSSIGSLHVISWKIMPARAEAFLVALALGALLYRPHDNQELGKHWALTRFLVFVVSLLMVGLIYKNLTGSTQIHSAVIVVTGGLSILSAFVQRILV